MYVTIREEIIPIIREIEKPLIGPNPKANKNIAISSFSKKLCGKTRQGHFTGVLTVLMKLFLMIRPDKVFLGEKDYQQLELVKGMVKAFHMGIEIVGCPTIRESDGLAMSSRNKNLTSRICFDTNFDVYF